MDLTPGSGNLREMMPFGLTGSGRANTQGITKRTRRRCRTKTVIRETDTETIQTSPTDTVFSTSSIESSIETIEESMTEQHDEAWSSVDLNYTQPAVEPFDFAPESTPMNSFVSPAQIFAAPDTTVQQERARFLAPRQAASTPEHNTNLAVAHLQPAPLASSHQTSKNTTAELNQRQQHMTSSNQHQQSSSNECDHRLQQQEASSSVQQSQGPFRYPTNLPVPGAQPGSDALSSQSRGLMRPPTQRPFEFRPRFLNLHILDEDLSYNGGVPRNHFRYLDSWLTIDEVCLVMAFHDLLGHDSDTCTELLFYHRSAYDHTLDLSNFVQWFHANIEQYNPALAAKVAVGLDPNHSTSQHWRTLGILLYRDWLTGMHQVCHKMKEAGSMDERGWVGAAAGDANGGQERDGISGDIWLDAGCAWSPFGKVQGHQQQQGN